MSFLAGATEDRVGGTGLKMFCKDRAKSPNFRAGRVSDGVFLLCKPKKTPSLTLPALEELALHRSWVRPQVAWGL